MERKTKTSWAIPEACTTGIEKLINGGEFNRKMVGAYYGSSLEYNFGATPQYLNAGDLIAPMDDEVRKVFKPKHAYGTFGAVRSDSNENQYRFETTRAIVEIVDKKATEFIADSFNSLSKLTGLEKLLVYQKKDGSKLSYAEALELQRSYGEHNQSVQKRIDQLIESKGLAPVYLNGKRKTEKFPDTLLAEIAEIAKTKKAITGFNLKIQVMGKHTISKDGHYARSSISVDQLDLLRKDHLYREKIAYSQGTVRVGTIVIPIQSVKQLKIVKDHLTKQTEIVLESWPAAVQQSAINLEKVEV